jgi:hypothetical protein
MVSKEQPRQFHLLDLFAYMAAACLCFAIVRLTFPIPFKILLVELIVLGFFYWATRGQKVRDPRLIRLMPFTMSVPMMLYIVWWYVQPPHPHSVIDYYFGVLMLIFVISGIWQIVGAIRCGTPMSRD